MRLEATNKNVRGEAKLAPPPLPGRVKQSKNISPFRWAIWSLEMFKKLWVIFIGLILFSCFADSVLFWVWWILLNSSVFFSLSAPIWLYKKCVIKICKPIYRRRGLPHYHDDIFENQKFSDYMNMNTSILFPQNNYESSCSIKWLYDVLSVWLKYNNLGGKN